jgi:NADH:ubiquinone oxidoreductase subunit C
VEVATALRDEFSFDLLSSVTGVDYIAENKMEVVYHACTAPQADLAWSSRFK